MLRRRSNPDAPRRTIGVVCLYRGLLSRFEQYLYHSLHHWVLYIHNVSKIPPPEDAWKKYYYSALKESGDIRLLGPFEQNGFDADVVFLLALRRQKKDEGWQGDMATKPVLLETAITRCKRRLYFALEDLREKRPHASARESQNQHAGKDGQAVWWRLLEKLVGKLHDDSNYNYPNIMQESLKLQLCVSMRSNENERDS